LWQELSKNSNAVTDGGNPVLGISFNGKTEYVYCPTSDEYRVTADVARKAADLGATIIAYGSWCDATYEAKQYAKKLGVTIMPYGALFAYLRRKGVHFK
jgi:hypothetical protein